MHKMVHPGIKPITCPCVACPNLLTIGSPKTAVISKYDSVVAWMAAICGEMKSLYQINLHSPFYVKSLLAERYDG